MERRTVQPSATERVILLDEPDTHLDYRSQQRLFDAVKRYSDTGASVLMATHSLAAVNRYPLDRIVVFRRETTTGRASARIASAEAAGQFDDAIIGQIGRALGVENASLLYDKCFVIIEGDTEQYALPLLYQMWSGNAAFMDGVRFINGHNNDGVIKFTRFLRDSGRMVVGIVDEDTFRVKSHRRYVTRHGLQSEGHVAQRDIFVLTPECFELAFGDDTWVRAIAKATGGKKRPRAASLANLRNDPKRYIEALNDFTSTVTKPELAQALVAALRRSEIPEVLADAFERAKHAASP